MGSLNLKGITRYAIADLRALVSKTSNNMTRPFDITYTNGENMARFTCNFNRFYAEKVNEHQCKRISS